VADRTVYLVSIGVHPGQEATLREYERHAVRVMRRHGGDFERVLRPAGPAGGGPDEVHLLAFATPDGFARFRADPELERYRPLRDAAVRQVSVVALTDVPLAEYLGDGASPGAGGADRRGGGWRAGSS
jgi:hypothetical protein